MITVKNLTKKFNDSFYALKEIDFEVKKGEIFGIVGSSGAGKSTLMRCLTGLEVPDQGSITFDGKDLFQDLRSARLQMGKVFQHFNLLSSRNALENVCFPLEISGRFDGGRRAFELLELVGLKDKAHHYPATLSGGEKQRVAIARALANSPKVLFSDEATSALDPKTTQTILELLLKINRELGLTIVMITHQMEVIKQVCSKVAVLDHGQIVESGDVSDLFATPKHPMTKRLLQGVSHEFLPQGKNLYRLTFKGKATGEPIISKLIKQHDIEVNILLGGIDALQTGIVGNLVVEITGQDLQKALDFLALNQVRFEKIT